jgi:hypothetical protein
MSFIGGGDSGFAHGASLSYLYNSPSASIYGLSAAESFIEAFCLSFKRFCLSLKSMSFKD